MHSIKILALIGVLSASALAGRIPANDGSHVAPSNDLPDIDYLARSGDYLNPDDYAEHEDDQRVPGVDEIRQELKGALSGYQSLLENLKKRATMKWSHQNWPGAFQKDFEFLADVYGHLIDTVYTDVLTEDFAKIIHVFTSQSKIFTKKYEEITAQWNLSH